MSPLDRTTEYQVAAAAAQQGWVTPEFALRKMPLKGVDAEIKRMDTVRRLQEVNQQQQQAIEQLQAGIEELNSDLEKAQGNVVDEQYRNKYEVIEARMGEKLGQLNKALRNAERINSINKKQIKNNAAQPQTETAVGEGRNKK